MKKKNRFLESLRPYIFIAPAIVGILVFTIYPMGSLIRMSFFDINQLNPDKTKFVGLDNYKNVFNLQSFRSSLGNTAVYTFFTVIFILALAVILAVWLGSKKNGLNTLTQTAAFTPHVVAMISIALIWIWLMEPNYGLLNEVLKFFGFKPIRWLQSSDTSMMSIIIVAVWKSVGYYTLILIASLQSIPQSIYEAAELDNSGKTRTLLKITLPMISPQIFFCLIVLTIGSFKVFETVKVMTNGGPNNSTNTLVFLIYQEVFQNARIGYGAVVGVVLMVAVGILTAIYFKFLSRKVHYQ